MQFNNKQAIDVLAKLHSGGFPSAIVAGGCVRDEIFGKPVKDIDVFVSYEDFDNRLVNIQEVLGREVVLEGDIDYEGGEDDEVQGVLTLEPHGDELPVQVIVLAPGMAPLDRVERFDFSFCQAAWDGKEVVTTCWFRGMYDFYLRRGFGFIILKHCESQHEFDRSMVRYERLKQKYPDWKLVVYPEFQKYQVPPIDDPLTAYFETHFKTT
jgi:tRNA nucleotidyltransferase/poly(A) polymerase